MGQTARFQQALRRLAMIDEGFVEGEAGLGLGPLKTSSLDPKTGALLQVAGLVAIGSPAVCLERSHGPNPKLLAIDLLHPKGQRLSFIPLGRCHCAARCGS